MATSAAPQTHTTGSATAFAGLVTRNLLIDALNEDLSREYQAIIEYVTDSQSVKHAAYMHMAQELDGTHANAWGMR